MAISVARVPNPESFDKAVLTYVSDSVAERLPEPLGGRTARRQYATFRSKRLERNGRCGDRSSRRSSRNSGGYRIAKSSTTPKRTTSTPSSTSGRVVRRADVPVLTIRPDDDVEITHPYEDVRVPTDGSDCANQALTLGVDVTDAEDAALHLLSVIALPALGTDARPDIQVEMLEESANDLLDEAAAFADDAGVGPASKTVECSPSIHKAILTYIEDHDIDLVVVGTHGRTGFDRYVLGSVTEYLVRTSPIPVLPVRASVTEP